MVPIQELLHRVQWDPAWRGSLFEVGYLDRLAGAIVRVPFGAARMEGGGRPALTLVGREGALVTIPLHRVRAVWRDGEIVWKRGAARSSDG